MEPSESYSGFRSSRLHAALPPPPSLSSQLEQENAALKAEKTTLEALIEVLYKQNLQYAAVLDQYKSTEKSTRKGINTAMRHIANVVDTHIESHAKIHTTEKQAVVDWDESWNKISVEEANLMQKKMEIIKQRIIEKGTEEVVIVLDRMKIDIKIL